MKIILGDIKIAQILADIEQSKNIRVIYAAESGSRAWGFASPDSDYDVRFIYVRPFEKYLCLEKIDDTINLQIDKIYDVSGWDIAKTLRQFYKSNFAVFEWANSPTVYKKTKEFEEVYKVVKKYFSPMATFAAYAGFAKNIYRSFEENGFVGCKKILYVLRTIFCRNYVAEKLSPPPVEFAKFLTDELPSDLRIAILKILERKKYLTERDKIEKNFVIQKFIEDEIGRENSLKENLPQENLKTLEELNKIFRSCVAGEFYGKQYS